MFTFREFNEAKCFYRRYILPEYFLIFLHSWHPTIVFHFNSQESDE